MKLFYRQFGTGKPVVILHGLFGVSDNWVTFGKNLSSTRAVYIPDLRNHGQSPHSAVFDFQSLCSDIYELCEDLGLETIDLIGHSLGGKTAMLLALQYPRLISKLVVVDISLRKSPPDRNHQKLLNAMLGVTFDGVQSRSEVEKQLAAEVPDIQIRQFLMKNVYWRDRQTLDWRLNLKAINDNLLSVFEGITFPGVFEGPALFIRGGKSDYIRDSDIPGIKSKFPGASVKTIESASHWVHADAPGEFSGLVSGFLSGN